MKHSRAHRSAAKLKDNGYMRYLTPWLVPERDFVRYLSRALRACRGGSRHAVLSPAPQEGSPSVLLVLTRYPDPYGILDAAYASFFRGRVPVAPWPTCIVTNVVLSEQ